MEALLADIYGEAALVAQGALPAAALTGSPDFIRALRGVAPPGGRYLQLYAADLGRGPDGRWWVLGDRTQAPSGAGYELENRLVISRAFPNLYNAMNVERLAPFFDGLAQRAGRQRRAQRSANLPSDAPAPSARPTSSRPIWRAIWASCWSRATIWWSATAASMCAPSPA